MERGDSLYQKPTSRSESYKPKYGSYQPGFKPRKSSNPKQKNLPETVKKHLEFEIKYNR